MKYLGFAWLVPIAVAAALVATSPTPRRDGMRMTALLRALDRRRLRDSAPQVREAFSLYRELRLSGMVAGNLLHGYPHYQAVRRLLSEMRRTEPSDGPRLDDLLAEVRGHHAEWTRIRELERPITPWEELGDAPGEQAHDHRAAGGRGQ